MSVVVTVQGAEAGGCVGAIAQRLTGPCVVLPFDALRREWIAKPGGEAHDAAVAAQQLKLLVAGYVKAGYHVVAHGDALDDGEARDDVLRLMRMVPGVATLAAGIGATAPVDLALAAGQTPVAVAEAIWRALPPDAVLASERGDGRA